MTGPKVYGDKFLYLFIKKGQGNITFLKYLAEHYLENI